MTTLHHVELIKAPPEKVFDLISRVEEFSEYSRHIKEVRAIGEGKFLWRVKVLNMKMEWESEVIESIRPVSFAWRSTKGVFNTGRYVLTPVEPDSTSISFTMEYELSDSRSERLIATLVEPVLDSFFKKSLSIVKERVEEQVR